MMKMVIILSVYVTSIEHYAEIRAAELKINIKSNQK